MRWVQRGLHPVLVSVLGVIVLAAVAYFVFTKALPGQSQFTVTAVMRNSNLLAPGSPVRVGGVDVGEVAGTGRWRHTDLAQVTMHLDSHRPVLHTDAAILVRPRLFLEGNFYVQLAPGTPGAPVLHDHGVIPVAHTADPVQLDQLLDTFPASVRGQLQQALTGLGQALDATPTRAQEARALPSTRGLSGAQAINQSFINGPGALRDSALAAQALTGGDGPGLGRALDGLGRAAEGLHRADGQLGSLVVDLNRTLSTTAAHSQQLRQTVALLSPTARSLRSAFTSLQDATPATQTFADELADSLGQVPATVSAALPWLAQAGPLLSTPELRGLLAELVPASGALARLVSGTTRFLPQIDRFDRCMNQVFIPTGYLKLDDGSNSSAMPNYQEFFSAMVAQAAEGQDSDGNGNLLSIGATGGSHTVESGQTNYYGADDTAFGTLAAAPLATHPAFPNHVPPLQRTVACDRDPIPDVNGQDSVGPADGSRPDAPAPALPDDPTGKLSP